VVTELGDEEVFAVADLIRREALLAAIRRNDFGSLDLPVGDVVTLDPSAKVAVGDIVLFRARPHTTSATDALGYVDQHAPPVLGHFVVGGSLRRSGLNVLPGDGSCWQQDEEAAASDVHLLLASCGLGVRGLGFFLVLDLGPVRLVTGVAGETTGVIGRDDLGKCLGLGAVGLVTARANDGGVRQWWL